MILSWGKILVSYLYFALHLVHSPTFIAEHSRNRPVSVTSKQLQLSQEESNFGDSSGPLYSMYSTAAEDEDNKMAERWQKDADGILIFVSLRVSSSEPDP